MMNNPQILFIKKEISMTKNKSYENKHVGVLHKVNNVAFVV